MSDIAELVQDSVANIASSGQLNAIIEEALASTVKDIVSSQLRSYSDFGKALQRKIESELTVDLDNISFTEYNKTVLNLVEGAVNNAITADAAEKLRADLEAMFGPPPEKITLSELVDQYREQVSEDECGCPGEIALIIKEREKIGSLGDRLNIGLHPTTTKGFRSERITEPHECDLGLHIYIPNEAEDDAGELRIVWDRSSGSNSDWMPTCMSGVARLLYQMYCAGSKIEFDLGFDSENYETRYGDGD